MWSKMVALEETPGVVRSIVTRICFASPTQISFLLPSVSHLHTVEQHMAVPDALHDTMSNLISLPTHKASPLSFSSQLPLAHHLGCGCICTSMYGCMVDKYISCAHVHSRHVVVRREVLVQVFGCLPHLFVCLLAFSLAQNIAKQTKLASL